MALLVAAAACGSRPGDIRSIGGSIEGLTGTGLVLQVNAGHDLAVPAGATSFRFDGALVEGTTYAVTVLTNPTSPAQTCTVDKGTGTVRGTDVTDVAVACVLVPTVPPAAPTGLACVAASNSVINLTWTDNSADETGFRIERSATSATAGFADLATTAADVAQYQDTGLSSTTPYWYRVRAFNGAGDSPVSDVATATTLRQIVLPKLQYTVRDIPPDGVPDVFVGADPFLDIKPGTEDRAVLQFDISAVPATLSNAELDLTIGTLDPGGTSGTISVYYWEASGFSDLGDFLVSGKTLVQTFTGPNVDAFNPYAINVANQVKGLRQSGRGYIGFLFVGVGNDRYRIRTTADAATEDQRPHLAISR